MKEELSDFLKTAYKYNRVKDLKEAFKEYPVEEEWHKSLNVIEDDLVERTVNTEFMSKCQENI